jgi:hypothetical protein
MGEIDEELALRASTRDKGKPYDWLGMLRVLALLRWLPRSNSKRFCSEEVASMLGPLIRKPCRLRRCSRPRSVRGSSQ